MAPKPYFLVIFAQLDPRINIAIFRHFRSFLVVFLVFFRPIGLSGGGFGGVVGGKGGVPRNVQNQDYSTTNPVKKSEKWSFCISRVLGYS